MKDITAGKILNVAESFEDKLEIILKNSTEQEKVDEDEKSIIKETEYFSEKIGDFISKIRYYSLPTKKGILEIDDMFGKYYVRYDDGKESNDLSCGTSLEIYDEDWEEWIAGRVEHDGEYYFYGHKDKPRLYVGMKVRKRIEI